MYIEFINPEISVSENNSSGIPKIMEMLLRCKLTNFFANTQQTELVNLEISAFDNIKFGIREIMDMLLKDRLFFAYIHTYVFMYSASKRMLTINIMSS